MYKNWAMRIMQKGSLANLKLEELEIGQIPLDHVLVKVECSTVNPSDILQILGKFPSLEAPFTAGIEGSGSVVSSGGGEHADSLVGKRVSILPLSGAWAEYAIVHIDYVYPLLDSITFEQAASLCVNPLTVVLMLEKITEGSHKGFIQNAAASSLGQILSQWATRLNISHIDLVRRQEQVDLLKSLGSEHVINTSLEGWLDEARELSMRLNITCAFDAIAGSATKDLCSTILNGGTVYNYGHLSGKDCEIDNTELSQQGKTFEQLLLLNWLMQKPIEDRIRYSLRVQENIDIVAIKYGQEVKLSNLVGAIDSYSVSATNNKILIRNQV